MNTMTEKLIGAELFGTTVKMVEILREITFDESFYQKLEEADIATRNIVLPQDKG